jgi:hypothetical protein
VEGNLIQAAFRRPLLFVLDGVGDEALEAVAAVSVAWCLDHGVREKLIKARDTLSGKMCET